MKKDTGAPRSTPVSTTPENEPQPEPSTEWFWETDPDHRFTYVSNEGTATTGLTLSDLAGRQRMDIAVDPQDGKWTRHLADLDAHRPFWGFEYSVMAASGAIAHLSTSGEPRFDESGRFTGYRGATSDITERRKVEQELRRARDLFQSVMEHAPMGIVLKDSDGRYQEVSQEWQRRFGYSRDEVVGKTPSELLPADIAKLYEASDSAVLNQGRKIVREEKLEEPNGRDGHYLTTLFPTLDREGGVSGMGLISVDITERKLAEIAVEDSEQQIRAVTDNLPFLISRHDRDWRYRFINREGAEWYGLPADRIIGESIFELFGHETCEAIRSHIEAVLSGHPASYSGSIAYPDGKTREVEITFVPDKAADDSVQGWFALAQDITERKRVARELADARELFNSLMRAAPFEIVFKDRDGKYLQVNRTWEQNNGRTNEDVAGRRTREIFPAQFAEVFAERDRAVLEGGQIIETEEPASHIDGTTHEFLSIRFPLNPADRSATAGLGFISMDITARKKAERALLEREEELETIADNLPVLMARLDRDWRYRFINREGAGWYGMPASEVVGKTIPDLFSREHVEGIRPSIESVLRGENERVAGSMQYPDGKTRNIEITFAPDRTADGEVQGWFALAQDLTARKRVERELEDAKELFNTLMQAAPFEIVFKDSEGKYLQVNRTWERNHGQTNETAVGRYSREIISAPFADVFADRDRAVLEGGQIVESEEPAPHPDGTIHDFFSVRFPLAPAGRSASAGIGLIAMDITARKKAEKALRVREEELSAITNNLPVLITRFDRKGRFEFMNRAGGEWYGRSTDDIVGKTVPEILGAESNAKVEPWIKRALTGERVQFEERMYYPDGTFRDVDIAYIPDVSRDGEIRGCFGLVQNITERKAAESRMRESEARLQAIVDNLPAFIIHVDSDQRYCFVNRVVEEWYGRPASEIIGRHVSEIIAPASYEKLRPRIETVLAGQDVRLEETLLYPDGITRSVDQRWIADRDENGHTRGWFSLGQDITERKRLEADLLRNERLATMGQLTGTVAHELRNPLGAVATSISAIRYKSNAAGLDMERSLARAERGIARCDRIITELLDFARAKGLQREPTRIGEWIATIIAEHDIPDGISLSMDLKIGDAEVPVDREDFRRALINVIDNACQAIENGPGGRDSVGGRISIACAISDGRLVCEIRDTGPGIPADSLHQVMEPLFSTKSFGTGLGLPTVNRIMEEHGGGIDIESEPGQGALVRLWLPLNAPPPEGHTDES